ncbi:MAG: ribosome-binding factor A, partial [bacterium]
MTLRSDRVGHQIQRLVATEIRSVKPAGSSLLTVTRCSVTPDLRRADIWLAGWDSLHESEQRQLRHDLQKAVGRESTTKFTPKLSIMEDA